MIPSLHPPPLSFPVHVSQPDPPSSLKETSNRELTEEKRRRKLVYSGQIYTVCRLSVRNTVFVWTPLHWCHLCINGAKIQNSVYSRTVAQWRFEVILFSALLFDVFIGWRWKNTTKNGQKQQQTNNPTDCWTAGLWADFGMSLEIAFINIINNAVASSQYSIILLYCKKDPGLRPLQALVYRKLQDMRTSPCSCGLVQAQIGCNKQISDSLKWLFFKRKKCYSIIALIKLA